MGVAVLSFFAGFIVFLQLVYWALMLFTEDASEDNLDRIKPINIFANFVPCLPATRLILRRIKYLRASELEYNRTAGIIIDTKSNYERFFDLTAHFFIFFVLSCLAGLITLLTEPTTILGNLCICGLGFLFGVVGLRLLSGVK